MAAGFLEKMSRRERIILALVGVVAVGAGFYKFEYEPQQARLKKVNASIEQIQGDVASLRQAVSAVRAQNVSMNIQRTRGDILRLQEEIEFFKSRMSGEVRDVIGVLKRQAALHGIQVKSINSQENEVTRSHFQYRRVQINLRMESGYRAIGKFISALEEVPAILSVQHFEVRRVQEILPRLNTSLTLRLYVM